MIQIVIPVILLYEMFPRDGFKEICESSDDNTLKLAGIMMYQTLFIGRISSHIVSELLPSYSFCSCWGTLSIIIHILSEYMIYLLTFFVFLNEDEGRDVIAFVFNALAMQYILQINCVPYILEEDEDKIIEDIKLEMVRSFILKSEKTNASAIHKKFQRWAAYISILGGITLSILLGICL